jgi:predicted MFS family arabinose efflux permease
MLAMVCLGVGEMLGGQLVGRIIDKKGSRSACLANIVIIFIMTTCTIVFIVMQNFNWLAFAMCFMWGF